MDPDLDIDKPSALVAVVVGLVASLLIDVGPGSRNKVVAQEAPAAEGSASVPATRAGCPAPAATPGAPTPAPPPLTAPGGPPDRQFNAAGTGAVGAVGTVTEPRPNDPCERPARLLPRDVPASAASPVAR